MPACSVERSTGGGLGMLGNGGQIVANRRAARNSSAELARDLAS